MFVRFNFRLLDFLDTRFLREIIIGFNSKNDNSYREKNNTQNKLYKNQETRIIVFLFYSISGHILTF